MERLCYALHAGWQLPRVFLRIPSFMLGAGRLLISWRGGSNMSILVSGLEIKDNQEHILPEDK